MGLLAPLAVISNIDCTVFITSIIIVITGFGTFIVVLLYNVYKTTLSLDL